MGSVQERRKKNDEARKRLRGRSWLSSMRGLRIPAILTAVLLLLCFLGVVEYWDRSAFCARCLQNAAIDQCRVFGVPVCQWTELTNRVHPVVRSTGLEALDCSPKVYEQIHGAACPHVFMFSGGGQRSCLAVATVVSSENRQYFPRAGAIAALYKAFGHVPDKGTARAIYAMIDRAYPVRDDFNSDMVRVSQLFISAVEGREKPPDLLARVEVYEQLGIQLARTALTLAEMTLRLRDVEPPADFRQVLNDFRPRLKPAAVEE